ncbi:TlpA family protein disulfide reductase [Hymenobacter sp. RP-2-7]|uniref:TlpA family protein disulfide reductase n=1 Tax=Hymenobacter polaris TaxID=2682546 RepID=A0A7Y0AAS0_9BACT|nr:TlpA disulfide reductase family protein [Hymenobacter polaris]NML63926.1 TlpA family protein disulfide reductase [Hymenobacter polaris]
MRYFLSILLLLGAVLTGGAQPISLAPGGRPRPATGSPVVPLAKGMAAPAFRLINTSGQAVALSDLRGKVMYLDFWFAGCKPCLAEAPAAAKLKQQFAGQEVVFAYISTETNVDDWKRSIEQHGLAGPTSVHLLDPEGRYATRAYHIDGFPTYVLLDRRSRVWSGNAPRPSDGLPAVKMIAQALAAR